MPFRSFSRPSVFCRPADPTLFSRVSATTLPRPRSSFRGPRPFSVQIPDSQSSFGCGYPPVFCLLFLTPCFGPIAAASAFWRAPLAILASVPPPLGIIGWANPLTAAGILFPGTAWLGLILILAFAGLFPLHPRISSVLVLVLAAIANVVYPGIPPPPAGWEAINTTFGGIGLEPSNPVIEFNAAQEIQQLSLESRAKVIVFPETVVPRWSLATELFWEPTLRALASSGKTILVGAGVDIPGTRKYRNAVVVRGAENGTFIQEIPVPIGMWQPFSNRGVPLEFAGTGVMSVAGERVLILICYEEFLTWPVLSSARKPAQSIRWYL